MYALALLLSAGTTAATTGLPYFHLGALDVGVPIQWFGMIVAVGVLLGATPLRRYAEWHGVSDDHIRGLLTWIMVSGFLGAHEFDVIAYQWDRIGDTTIVTPSSWWFLPTGLWPSNWPLVLRIWDGISSYGGFIGGAIGFAIYVWWKRLPARLFADIAIVGLLPAFSIGRIGCTVVSDHVGAAVEPGRWYAFLAMNYPRTVMVEDATTHKLVPRAVNSVLAELFNTYDQMHPGTAIDHLQAWNLGLIEFAYLVPVNLLILWLAFRPSKRMPAGFIIVLTGVLYAPVRFFLDFLRPEDTDPRYLGLTFAQWSSILVFGVAVYAASRILKTGVPAETVTATSREAQERLRVILREDEESQQKQEADKVAEIERKKAEIARARAEREREDADAAEEAAAAATAAAERGKAALAGTLQEADDDDAVAANAVKAGAANVAKAGAADEAKPAVSSSGGKAPGGKAPGGKASGGKSTGNKSTGNKNRKR
jgi:phosphatidylglycerol:prolipoprotein diacylglycerol transferase